MNEFVFESLIVSGTQRRAGRVKWYFLATTFGYLAAVAGTIVGGILLLDPQISAPVLSASLVVTAPPPPPPPPAGGAQPVVAKPTPSVIIPTGFVTPTATPKSLPPTTEGLPEISSMSGVPGGVIGGVPGGVIGGVLGGVVGGVLDSAGPLTAPPPPPPPPEAVPLPAKPVRISSGVLRGSSIRQVAPVYPSVARSIQLAGAVQVSVVVDEQGNVISAEVVNGHPLFHQAALEAARQWKFRPTMLNGSAVKITGVLTFTFKWA